MPGLTLAIDTATAACSAALIAGDRVVASASETVGRGHAEQLMPMIEALLAEAGSPVPTAILIDCGPGSFTGVRVGLAAAIGLGIGWGVPVEGMSSTALLAIAAGTDCAVAITGGHGELFVERFSAAPFASLGALVSLPPAEAAAIVPEPLVIGSGAAALVAARGWGEAREAFPDAADARLLADAFHLPPRPIYGRAPDARPKVAA